jgi:tetratricopeptide (TPR) repeat protein
MRRWRQLAYLTVIILLAGLAPAQHSEYVHLMEQGAALERSGSYSEALAVFQEALGIAEHDHLHPRAIASSLNQVGMVYDDLGKFADAIRQFRRALAMVESMEGKDNLNYAVLLGNLAADYGELKQDKTARPLLREAIDIYVRHDATGDPRLAIARIGLAQSDMNSGRYRDAQELLEQALAVLRLQQQASWRRQTAITLNNLGVVHRLQKHHAESEPLFLQSIRMIEEEFGVDHPRLLEPLNNLALAYIDLGRPEDALATMRRARTIAEARLRPEHPSYGRLLVNYGNVLRKTGHKAEGKQLEAQGKSALIESARSNGAGMTVDVTAFRPQ